MIDIEDALLMRAEFCAGTISYAEANYELGPVLRAINEILGKNTAWIDNPLRAEFESLLTREVLMTGGLE